MFQIKSNVEELGETSKILDIPGSVAEPNDLQHLHCTDVELLVSGRLYLSVNYTYRVHTRSALQNSLATPIFRTKTTKTSANNLATPS